MQSFTLISLLCLLVALLATPSFGDYVERSGYDQKFGSLEARDPLPKKRVNSFNDKDASPTESSAPDPTNAASENMANMMGVGIMAIVAGAAAMH